MTNRNIVLIGFMGSGKSMTSNRLADILGRKVVSTDALIEAGEGRPISEIFEKDGEAHFRALEKRVVESVSAENGIIIDCGGGVVLDSHNIDLLRKNGLIIYLKATPECLLENVMKSNNRPLLNVEDPLAKITDLLKERGARYEQADITVDADFKSIDEIADLVLKELENE